MSLLLGRLLALAALLPLLGFWLGRPGGGALLATLLFALPFASALRARLRGDEAHLVDEAAWLTVLLGALVTPLLPTMLFVDGFDAPVFVALGALAYLGLRGRLTRLTAAPRWGRLARVGFAVWAGWSVGSALRAVWVHTPAGTPWLGEELWLLWTAQLGQVSSVAATAPLSALFLRLLLIAVAWSGFELALRALGRGEGERFERRFVRALAWALVLGLGVAVVEFVEESLWRGDSSPLARLVAGGLPRNPRPLLDHNALGSALVLVLPLMLVAGLLGLRARHRPLVRRWGLAAAALVAAFLLVSSRSKSALAGAFVGVVLGALLLAWSRGGGWRRAAAGLLAAGALVIALVNVAPDGVVDRVGSTRYGQDLLRVVRFDAARDYLRENRTAVWTQARGVADEAPAVGVGLGRLPLRMIEHRAGPEVPGWFKPLHENAHSQYLQWRAEEGWLGLLLALGVLGFALLGALRRRSTRALAAAGGLGGLAINLLVGHALLVSSVALLFAAFVGWLLAGGSMTRVRDEAAEQAGRRPLVAPVACVAAGLVALLPAFSAERATDLRRSAFGTYPWVAWADRGGDGSPARSRAVGPRAEWYERWQAGTVLKIPVLDVRDARFEGRTTLDVWVDGELVLEGLALARDPSDPANPNRTTFVRIERPQGVAVGDWIHLRVEASDYFVGTRAFAHDPRRVSFKMSPAFFNAPR